MPMIRVWGSRILPEMIFRIFTLDLRYRFVYNGGAMLRAVGPDHSVAFSTEGSRVRRDVYFDQIVKSPYPVAYRGCILRR